MYTIEKDIDVYPISLVQLDDETHDKDFRKRIPWDSMEVGDSVVIYGVKASRVIPTNWDKRYGDKCWTVRQREYGTRLWRVG